MLHVKNAWLAAECDDPERQRELKRMGEARQWLARLTAPSWVTGTLADALDEAISRRRAAPVLRWICDDQFAVGPAGDERRLRIECAGATIFALAVTAGPEHANRLLQLTEHCDARLGDRLTAQRRRLAEWLTQHGERQAAGAVVRIAVRAKDGLLSVNRR